MLAADLARIDCTQRFGREAALSSTALSPIMATGATNAKGLMAALLLESTQPRLEGVREFTLDILARTLSNRTGEGRIKQLPSCARQGAVLRPFVAGIRHLADQSLSFQRQQCLTHGPLGRPQVLGEGSGRVTVAVANPQIVESFQLSEFETVLSRQHTHLCAQKGRCPFEKQVKSIVAHFKKISTRN